MARGTTTIYQLHFANNNFYYLNEDETRKYDGFTWKTMDKLKWDNADLQCLVAALDPQVHWQKTVPACTVIQPDGLAFVDADQYEIHWDDVNKTWNQQPILQAGCCSLSLKLALVTASNGAVAAGVVVMHFSGTK